MEETLELMSETVTFGTGCFWCTEILFQQLNGVLKVTPGFSGGHVDHPSYQQVCVGNTGHAEVTQIEFDPRILSFDDLLEVFWKSHDPTTLNRQGNDVGSHYRSVIFYHNEKQKMKAEQYKLELDKSMAFKNPVVTEISPFSKFYVAENYHHDYYNHNSSQPYCQLVIRPKLDKFKKIFADKIKV
jgi:peptide-methionine (S)-S-oxide reductase